LGNTVDIKIDKENRVGKYGRLLGKVMAHGLDMGETMLTLGLVKSFGKKLEGELPVLGKMFSLKQWF